MLNRLASLKVDKRVIEFSAPGLKIMTRAAGRRVPYWVAQKGAIDRGFTPKTVRLSADLDDVDSVLRMAQRCTELQNDMWDWLALGHVPASTEATYKGTLQSLIDVYKGHRLSPYRNISAATQATYLSWIKLLDPYASRHLVRLPAIELRDWYEDWRRPAEKDGPERVRRAYSGIQILRILIGFGVSLEIKDCARLHQAMSTMTFEAPKPRSSFMTYAQAEAFVEKAIELGEVRMALGHACQFELMLRQGDVIGRWERRPAKPGEKEARTRVWSGGLTFEGLEVGGVLHVTTSKTGRRVSFDTTEYPLLQRVLALIEPDKRTGPFVVRADGLAPEKSAYTKLWRKIATEAGIPSGIWNMDNRASGVTEARDAGADMDDVAKHAQHASAATTRRVYDRSTVEVTSRVARKRVQRRSMVEAKVK